MERVEEEEVEEREIIPIMVRRGYWVEAIGVGGQENIERGKKVKRFSQYAQWFYEKRRYERAASILERSVSFCQKWGKVEPIMLMGLVSNLIIVYSELKREVQVGRLCERLVKIKRYYRIRENEEVANMLIEMGEYLELVGLVKEANQLICEGMVMRVR